MFETTLGDACERVDYGLTTSATAHSVGPRFLRITDIEHSHVDWNAVPYCVATSQEIQKYSLTDGDIVVARTGASTGRSQWVRSTEPAVFASYLVRFRVRPEFDSRFVSYILQSADWLRFVDSQAHGKSAQPNMSASAMAAFSFMHPPLAEQQAIAEVLGALDDKIAANTALALAADGVIRTEYEKFEMTDVRVGQVANSPRVSVSPSKVAADELYVGLEHVGRRHMWLTDGGTAGEVSSAKSAFAAEDVLFGKLRPYFHKVVLAPRAGICSTDILVVRPSDHGMASVLLAALTSDAVIEQVVAASEGTRMPRTSWKDLSTATIRWPRPDQAAGTAARLDSISRAVIAAVEENRTLAATRDALLPQLMSGKLRVRDAEAMASTAGATTMSGARDER